MANKYVRKKPRDYTGINNPNWKNKISYIGVHAWIYRSYGKAKKCDKCKTQNAKKYEWALIKGKEYEKKIENFMQLCVSCHRKYDISDQTRQKMSIAKIGKTSNAKGKNWKWSKNKF